jgi:hypothetical protein
MEPRMKVEGQPTTMDRLRTMIIRYPGMTREQLRGRLAVPPATFHRVISDLMANGELEIRVNQDFDSINYGQKGYFLCSRNPM